MGSRRMKRKTAERRTIGRKRMGRIVNKKVKKDAEERGRM